MVHHEFRDLWTRATGGDVTMAKAAIFAALRHAPAEDPRPADHAVLAFMAATVVGIAMATGVALSMAAAGPEPLPAVIPYRIGNTPLTAPREWLRPPVANAGRVEQLELIIDWPRQLPATSDNKASASRPFDGSVLISLAAADPLSAPIERLNRVYSRFLDPRGTHGPAGLVAYTFRPGSRYENERLFVTSEGFTTPTGDAFFARCPDNERKESPTNLCTTTLHIGMLDAVVRFSPDRLGDWPRLIDGVTRIVTAMIHKPARLP